MNNNLKQFKTNKIANKRGAFDSVINILMLSNLVGGQNIS